jgi:hypothetical protein
MSTMNKNKIILCLALVGIVFIATSCFEEKDPVYEGAALIEFSNNTYASLAKLVPQSQGAENLVVQLVTPQQDQALTLNYEIDAASTAVEGTHYKLASRGSFTIPAHESFGAIAVELLPGIDPANTTERRTIIFVLTGGPAVKVSENYKKLTLTIRS